MMLNCGGGGGAVVRAELAVRPCAACHKDVRIKSQSGSFGYAFVGRFY